MRVKEYAKGDEIVKPLSPGQKSREIIDLSP